MNRRGPLPDAIFSWVHERYAIVNMEGAAIIVFRDPQTGVVSKNPRGLDLWYLPTGERWVRHRWLSDPRRRELTLPYKRGRFTLTDEEWNDRRGRFDLPHDDPEETK